MGKNPHKTTHKKPQRQRKMKNAIKNAALTTEAVEKRLLAWHVQVAKDFEAEFGDEVWLQVVSSLYISTSEEPGAGTLSSMGSPPNTIDMIGHLIRQTAKDGVTHLGMTPEEAGRTLMAEITKVAGLSGLEQILETKPEIEEIDTTPRHIITLPKL